MKDATIRFMCLRMTRALGTIYIDMAFMTISYLALLGDTTFTIFFCCVILQPGLGLDLANTMHAMGLRPMP